MVRPFGIKPVKRAGPSTRKLVVQSPRCRKRGRDWAGRSQLCILAAGHKGKHEGSTGAKLKVSK